MRPEWKKQRSSLVREGERLDREDRERVRAELEAQDAAKYDRLHEDVDGLPRWVRSAMRGPV